MDEDIRKWVKPSEYDVETAKAMLNARKYLYVLFCCQQAVEKLLKAVIVKEKKQFPPKIHDLLRLVQMTSLEPDEKQRDFLDRLNAYYIETRYPDEVLSLSKGLTGRLANAYLSGTEEILRWIRKVLK
jgi:HEPN domain-containing protein